MKTLFLHDPDNSITCHPREGGEPYSRSHRFVSRSRQILQRLWLWIPAYAGMTNLVRLKPDSDHTALIATTTSLNERNIPTTQNGLQGIIPWFQLKSCQASQRHKRAARSFPLTAAASCSCSYRSACPPCRLQIVVWCFCPRSLIAGPAGHRRPPAPLRAGV